MNNPVEHDPANSSEAASKEYSAPRTQYPFSDPTDESLRPSRRATLPPRRAYALVCAILTAALIFPVRLYQIMLSPLLPSVCRYTPSCSNYFIQAVQKYGPIKGAWKGTCRICRCHPFHPGGYDPP